METQIQQLKQPTYYYTTILYPDFQNKEIQIVLEHDEPILEDDDVSKGFVEKEMLFDYFAEILATNGVKPEHITEKSIICEYKWCDEEGDSAEEISITKKLLVK